MGAWIEINYESKELSYEDSVAPLVGAWIEMISMFFDSRELMSLPLWERGLKFWKSLNISSPIMSLPLWERGLKLGNPPL